ncbi:MAG: GtrA family protein [Candidatus Heimdallarchaeaceae archaeon]
MESSEENSNSQTENKFTSSKQKARYIRFLKFTTVSLVGWGLTELVVFLGLLLFDSLYQEDILFTIWIFNVHKIHIITLIAIILVMFYNYIINKIWTFRKQEKEAEFNTLRQFVRFAIVGASGTIINLGLVHLFAVTLHLNEYFATTIGFLVSVTTNFIFNDIWTFNPRFAEKKRTEST